MKKNSSLSKKVIWLAAGGTGGHISPAAAIAMRLLSDSGKQKKEKIEPVLITLPQNSDYSDIRNLASKKVKIFACKAPKIPRSPLEIIKFPVSLFQSLRELKQLAQTHPPSLVLAFGGYPSFPALFFARFHSIPFCLHEQNKVEGVVTRLMKRAALRLYTSFPGNYGSNALFLGNPLRALFQKYPQKRKPRQKKEVKNILFIGGSQGASDLNSLFMEMATDHRFQKISFTISTGARDYEKVKKSARKKDRVESFIKDMPAELLKADVVIARAGSGTIYEILWALVPSLLVPYPYAKDNHQRKNADALEHEGMALVYDKRPFQTHEVIEMIHSALDHGTFSDVARQMTTHRFPMNGDIQICHDLRGLVFDGARAKSERK